MSQFGAKARGNALAVAPGRVGVLAGSSVPRRREGFPGGKDDSFRYANRNTGGAYGCGVFRDMIVVVVSGARTRPGQWNVDAPAVVFSKA
ncbi:MAG: hypothetical protein ACM3ZO_04220 [Clostridia bacterium]